MRRGNSCSKGLQVGKREGLRERKNIMWLAASKGGKGVAGWRCGRGRTTEALQGWVRSGVQL